LSLQALILAGGIGSRLGALVEHSPKPFLSVGGNPFLQKIVERLINQGITDVIFCLGYKPTKIMDFFGDGSKWEMRFSYVLEENLMGTGGAIRGALHLIDGPDILVLNGDSFCYFDVYGIMKRHVESQSKATLTLLTVEEPDRFGLVEFNDKNEIVSFVEKDETNRVTSFINAGVYVLSKQLIIDINPSKPISLEKEIFTSYLNDPMYSFVLNDNRFIDIGTPESLAVAERFFEKG
jgi:NDP-sugar pyrophosphorylase family protein